MRCDTYTHIHNTISTHNESAVNQTRNNFHFNDINNKTVHMTNTTQTLSMSMCVLFAFHDKRKKNIYENSIKRNNALFLINIRNAIHQAMISWFCIFCCTNAGFWVYI